MFLAYWAATYNIARNIEKELLKIKSIGFKDSRVKLPSWNEAIMEEWNGESNSQPFES